VNALLSLGLLTFALTLGACSVETDEHAAPPAAPADRDVVATDAGSGCCPEEGQHAPEIPAWGRYDVDGFAGPSEVRAGVMKRRVGQRFDMASDPQEVVQDLAPPTWEGILRCIPCEAARFSRVGPGMSSSAGQ
jgi:hypothetical protein